MKQHCKTSNPNFILAQSLKDTKSCKTREYLCVFEALCELFN